LPPDSAMRGSVNRTRSVSEGLQQNPQPQRGPHRRAGVSEDPPWQAAGDLSFKQVALAAAEAAMALVTSRRLTGRAGRIVVSAQEGYNAGSLDPGTPEVQRNIMGGPFRYTNKPEGGPMPNTRVVYEKPILGPEKLGEKLALNSKGQGSRFDYICRGLNALQLGQQNAASAAEAATKGIGLRLWRATVGDDVVLASVMPGRGKPVLIVKPDGTVVRGTADIAPKAELDVNEPWTLTIVGEDAPLLPGR